MIFSPENIKYPETLKEETENINNIEITSYLIKYDEIKIAIRLNIKHISLCLISFAFYSAIIKLWVR